MSQPSTPQKISPGTLIAGKYRLLRPIGEGSMGSVWAAKNEPLQREVALKLLVRPSGELRVRLEREARALGTLRHRNILDVVDVGQTADGDPFLVMQLLDGENLAELLARTRRLDAAKAARIGRDVARALSVAHAVPIIHRDLKPANIFLHREPGEDVPVVKVLDFGVAKNLSVSDGLHTVVGGAVGSPLYMSPEQIRAEPDIDHRADLWGLGVLMFEMITGRRPFEGDARQVFAAITGGEIPTVDRYCRGVDPALVQVIARCMRRPREERFASAADLAAALELFTVPAPPASTAQPLDASLDPDDAATLPLRRDVALAVVRQARWTERGTLKMTQDVAAGLQRALAEANQAAPSSPGPAEPLMSESTTLPLDRRQAPALHTTGSALLDEERRRRRMAAAIAGAVVGGVIAGAVMIALFGWGQGPASPRPSTAQEAPHRP